MYSLLDLQPKCYERKQATLQKDDNPLSSHKLEALLLQYYWRHNSFRLYLYPYHSAHNQYGRGMV